MTPESPERTREEIVAYTPNGIELDPVTQTVIDWIGDSLGPENVDLNIGVQQELKSPAYFQDRLLLGAHHKDMTEHPILFFQANLLEVLGRLAEGSSTSLHSDRLSEAI